MSRNKNPVKKRENASGMIRGGGDVTRKTTMALALTLLLALPLLAQPISALIVSVKTPSETGDGMNSEITSNESYSKTCPKCGCMMKLCIDTSEYKFVCRCGCYVLR